ncbi:MAG: DUF3482 domain-containing protein [Myxococcales bacterium]|nr:DUF3482 domain-containing protein [Myxococcales bacterium]
MKSSERSAPALAVVGCVNMGKSSIVATLVEDDTILVAPEAGSTTDCAAYDLKLGKNIAFSLIDTPGFQNARRALAWVEQWLKDNQSPNVTATQAIRAFFKMASNNPSFSHEARLLQPILNEDSGVLYVVDGTQPYLQRYEAEMRLLAMTGAPRMGVINLRGTHSPYAGEWDEALRPWFKVVRFDAHGADAEARLRLFASFRGVDDAWGQVVDQAIEQLREERSHRHDLAAATIAHLIVDILSFDEEASLETNRERQVKRLSERLFDRLRKREREARQEIEVLYRHHRLQRSETSLAIIETDLLDKDQWRLMGLSASQLASAGAAAGALAGGVLDASVGGASFLAGTVIGAAVGGVGAIWGAQSLARVRVLGAPLGGRTLRVETPAGVQFPFVLLNRAILHWRLVSGRAHARRDALSIEAGNTETSIVKQLSTQARKELTYYFTQIRKRRGRMEDGERRAMIRAIRALAPDTHPQAAISEVNDEPEMHPNGVRQRA